MIKKIILTLVLIINLVSCSESHETTIKNQNSVVMPQETVIKPQQTVEISSDKKTDTDNHIYPISTGWTPIHVKIIKNNNANEFSDAVFINSIEGWKATYSSGAMNQQEIMLYKTTDGGRIWSEIASSNDSLPLETKTGITFLNSKIGWISTMTPKEGYIGLYKTLDGGVTWEYQNLQIPGNYTKCLFVTYPPVFFSEDDGVLLTKQNDLKQLVFVTHDGGKEWVAIEENSNNENLKWSFNTVADNTLWEVTYKNMIWKSTNGYMWSQNR